jgi:hypothetical protein
MVVMVVVVVVMLAVRTAHGDVVEKGLAEDVVE